MAKTKKRQLKNRKLNKRRKSMKYNMKGCYNKKLKKCKKCNRIHYGKHQSGGCSGCQMGGNTVGIFQNVANVAHGFGDSVHGIYNGFNALSPPVSSDPTEGHFQGYSKFKY
jgi:hypothetical protein